MSFTTKRKLVDFLLGFTLALALFGVPFVSNNGLFPPTPYSNVRLDEYSLSKDNLRAGFSFIKTDQCVFDDIGAFGVGLGYPTRLNMSFPAPEEGDRYRGKQGFFVDIELGGKSYSTVEVKVRHICGGNKRDTTFYTFKEELNG